MRIPFIESRLQEALRRGLSVNEIVQMSPLVVGWSAVYASTFPSGDHEDGDFWYWLVTRLSTTPLPSAGIQKISLPPCIFDENVTCLPSGAQSNR